MIVRGGALDWKVRSSWTVDSFMEKWVDPLGLRTHCTRPVCLSAEPGGGGRVGGRGSRVRAPARTRPHALPRIHTPAFCELRRAVFRAISWRAVAMPCRLCRLGSRVFPVSKIPYPEYFGSHPAGRVTVRDMLSCVVHGACAGVLAGEGAAATSPLYVFERVFLNAIAPELQEDFPKVLGGTRTHPHAPFLFPPPSILPTHTRAHTPRHISRCT